MTEAEMKWPKYQISGKLMTVRLVKQTALKRWLVIKSVQFNQPSGFGRWVNRNQVFCYWHRRTNATPTPYRPNEAT